MRSARPTLMRLNNVRLTECMSDYYGHRHLRDRMDPQRLVTLLASIGDHGEGTLGLA